MTLKKANNHMQERKDEAGQTTRDRQMVLTAAGPGKAYRIFVLPLLFSFCAVFYYAGEIVDLLGLEALRWSFFYAIHDTQRLLFLLPIIYTGYVAGVKGAIIITLVSFIVFLPRAFLISPYPDPVLRMGLFELVALLIGILTGVARNEYKRRSRLEIVLKHERDRLISILERMEDGVLIVGPDYRIRFLNMSLKRDFGEGLGSYCYHYLNKLGQPCPHICHLAEVIKGKTARWRYDFTGRGTYELVASPYRDDDGTFCQLTTFHKTSSR